MPRDPNASRDRGEIVAPPVVTTGCDRRAIFDSAGLPAVHSRLPSRRPPAMRERTRSTTPGQAWLETRRSTAPTQLWVEVWVGKTAKPRTLTWHAFATSGWTRLSSAPDSRAVTAGFRGSQERADFLFVLARLAVDRAWQVMGVASSSVPRKRDSPRPARLAATSAAPPMMDQFRSCRPTLSGVCG